MTELPELPIASEDAALAVCNMGAAFSAAIRNEETGRIELVSRLSCFEDDDEAWRLYVPMVAFAAMYQSDIFLNLHCQTPCLSSARVCKIIRPPRRLNSRWPTSIPQPTFLLCVLRVHLMLDFMNAIRTIADE